MADPSLDGLSDGPIDDLIRFRMLTSRGIESYERHQNRQDSD